MNINKNNRILLGIGLISVVITGCAYLPFPEQKNNEISIAALRGHIYYLASDSLEGRGTGTPGNQLAADYIADELFKTGVKPLGDNGYQYFDVVTNVAAGPDNVLKFGDFTGTLGTDYSPVGFSENATVTAPVIFAGYGFDFDLDSLQWHDYTNLDVVKKWVLLFRGDPDLDNPHSPLLQFSSLRSKVLKARDKGAAGVLFVSGPKLDEADDLMPLHYDQTQQGSGLPVFHIKRSVADQLLAGTGNTVADLEAKMIETMQPFGNGDLSAITLTGTADTHKTTAKAQNIVGYLKGSDPVLNDQLIVIGAHYDHLGYGGVGSGSRTPDTTAIHNGADDNASGVAAMLELARKLHQERNQLKRSVLFMAFGGEEMGLLGSKYFSNHPLLSLDKIQLMLNMDMVGRLDSTLTIGGTGTAKGLESIVLDAAKYEPFKVKVSPEGYGPSDHASFYIKDVPVLFFFTGIHDDYHTPADDPEKVNYKGEQAITEFANELVMTLGNRAEKLTWQEAGPKDGGEMRRAFKVTLGVMPDYAGQTKGLRIDGVRKGGPADRGGIQKGDIIIAMEGKPVQNIYDYMYRLAEFKAGQRISVDVMRDGKKVILIVDL
ncbi:MAG TPA: aminopeptidase [Candidatus Marinimicrobia bacterium]|nr:MAG: hypothetical protein AUJ47_01430 [Candidatus Marinimicrobia bacterium CG1_02_48_14]PJA54182.1 MAG: aminopeptidase [Candidatus Marinimicrobia bacterium CG_4_9_14_3_um_filter_48_9]HCW76121.1 aminopeptidase [Candidatus Neomarinimicrobiota bacterium]